MFFSEQMSEFFLTTYTRVKKMLQMAKIVLFPLRIVYTHLLTVSTNCVNSVQSIYNQIT